MDAVEVFADVSCPFAHVGLRRFVERRGRRGAFRPLYVRAWPLEFVNGVALAPGATAEKVALLRASVAPDLFTGFDPAAFPSTSLPALALTEAAYAVDRRTGERVALALRWALFEEGRNIADDDVLATIAEGHGVGLPTPRDMEAVREDWLEGQRRGVVGSPHFFVGSSSYFCPALRIERVDGELHVDADPTGFDALVSQVLAA